MDRRVDDFQGARALERAPGTRIDNGQWFDPHEAARHPYAWRSPIPWPHRIGVLPAEARALQHRTAAIPLDEPRGRDRRYELTGPVHVITGPSGVGKTQLTAHYVRTLWDADEVDLLVWIPGAARESVLSAFGEAAELVDRGSADLPDAVSRAERFLLWAKDTHKRWIVVFDDLRDASVVTELWPSGNPNGRVIVTTTLPFVALLDDAHAIPLNGFTPEEARDFLTTSLLDEPELLDQAEELAADLEYLPLSLAQAAAYIRDQKITCADYRKRLAATDSPPIAATSELCGELADDLVPGPIARMLRDLLAYLDGRGFPADVCTQPVVLHHLSRFAGRPVSVRDVTEALDCLHRLGLLTRDTTDPHLVQIAAYTQEAAYARIPTEAHWLVAHVVAEALTTCWPVEDREDALTRSLRDNATGLRDRAGDMLWTPDCHLLLLRLGDSLGSAGLARAAADHFAQMARLALRHLGPDHPRTLASRYRHAHWSGEAGDHTIAIDGFAQLLHDRVRTLGPEHPDTLDVWAQLATWQGNAGQLAEAAEQCEMVFEQCVRVYGDEHVETLRMGGKLADLVGKARGPHAAVGVLAPIIGAGTRGLGSEHPETLALRHDLANWQGLAGYTSAAMDVLKALLNARLRLLGEEHPDTLLTRHDLLNWQGMSGDTEGAVNGYVDLLDRANYLLGSGHPHTLAAKASLEHWRV